MRSLYFACALATSFVCLASPSLAVDFGSETVLRGGLNGAETVAAGDLDGDGLADVVGIGGGKVVYALNGGDGTTWTHVDMVSATRPRHVELADLDGDDDLDVIYTDWSEDRAYWFRNNLSTSGTFSGRGTVATVNGADGIAVGDLDGDDDLDLVVAGREGDEYYWVENTDGNGSWTRHFLASHLDGPQVVAIGDLDGDGDNDIVGGGSEDTGSLVWWENTAGDATAWTLRTIDVGWFNSISIFDLDQDGDQDLVIQENNASPGSSVDIVLWWENTDGTGTSWTEHAMASPGRDATKGNQLVDLLKSTHTNFETNFETGNSVPALPPAAPTACSPWTSARLPAPGSTSCPTPPMWP